MHLISILALICALASTSQAEDCGTCLKDNAVYCINQKEYFLCENNQAKKDKTYQCSSGTVCSNAVKICVTQKEIDGNSNIKDVCVTDPSECNSCPATGQLACVSRNQYARCIGGKVSPTIYAECPTDTTCVQNAVTKYGDICVPDCLVKFYNYSATCTTPVYKPETPPPTKSPIDLQKACKDEKRTDSTYLVKNSDDCKSYIYCEVVGEKTLALLLYCPTNKYINLTSKQCDSSKLTDCKGPSK